MPDAPIPWGTGTWGAGTWGAPIEPATAWGTGVWGTGTWGGPAPRVEQTPAPNLLPPRGERD